MTLLKTAAVVLCLVSVREKKNLRQVGGRFFSYQWYLGTLGTVFMPRLGGAYCFRRVRSQRKSVDWGTMGPALGGAYECYAHISSLPGPHM